MMKTIITEKKIKNSFSKMLSRLSLKEKIVLEKRIWVNGMRETLQGIGDFFNPSITRERVRQIEDAGIQRIWTMVKTNELSIIQDMSYRILASNWWILVRDKLINALIKEMNISKDINTYILDAIIQSWIGFEKSKPRLWTRTYFTLTRINKKHIEAVYKEALMLLKKKKDVMTQNDLYKEIQQRLHEKFWEIDILFINSVMDIYNDIVKSEDTLIWLARWKILNPKTLKDKAIYVMKKERVPMHFVDVANKIIQHLWGPVKTTTIHNELIRNKEFVLIGRWIYALKEWWFKPWNVLDVIQEILKKSNKPLTLEEIVKRVLKVRNIKETTVYMNLQNKKVIKRVGRNFYWLQGVEYNS